MRSDKATTELISHTPRSIHPLDLKALDEALEFLETHQENASTDEVTLRAIRRKIDWHIFPILSCCQLVQSLDKYALNVGRWTYQFNINSNEYMISTPLSWGYRNT